MIKPSKCSKQISDKPVEENGFTLSIKTYLMMINNKTWEKFLKSGPKQTSAISASIQYSAETSSKYNRKTKEVEELRGWGKTTLFFFFLMMWYVYWKSKRLYTQTLRSNSNKNIMDTNQNIKINSILIYSLKTTTGTWSLT